MEVSLKIQHLKESDDNPPEGIVFTHEFDIPQEQMLEKRGRLFTVFSMKAKGDFDLASAATLFVETVQENYYRVTDNTPLHALEKSLSRAHNSLLTFRSNDEKTTLGAQSSELKLSFGTALIWNKVLYVSYLGKPAVYLIRGAGVRNLGSDTSHSEIWTSSSILDDEDVLIIGTEEFAQAYPANEISNSLGSISQNIKTHENKESLKAMLLKVSIKQAESSGKFVKKITQTRFTGGLSSTLKNLQDKVIPKKKLSEKFKLYQSKKAAPISSISGISNQSAQKSGPLASSSTRRIPKSKPRSKPKGANIKKLAVGIFMLSLAAYLSYNTFFKEPDKKPTTELTFKNTDKDDSKNYSSVMGVQTPNMKYPVVINTKDIKEKIVPIYLSLLNKNTVVLLDKSDGALIKIDTNSSESTEISNDFDSPTLVKCAPLTELCILYGNSTVYVISPKTPDDIDRYTIDLENVTDIYPYANAIYILTTNEIYRLALSANASPQKWIEDNQKFFNASSFVVDGNIYVLTNDRIYKYYDGKRVSDFTIDSQYLNDPSQLNIRGNNLYVFNRADTAIAVFDKFTGNFIKEVKIEGLKSEPRNVLFTVTEEDKPKGIFLDGYYMHKIELSE